MTNRKGSRMKAQERRFMGNGNCWVGDGHYRGWQVTCGRCGAGKIITTHSGSSPHPRSIIKRLVGAGWTIGHKPENDLCCACGQNKAIEEFVSPPPDNIIEMVDVSPKRTKPMSPHEWHVLDKLTTPAKPAPVESSPPPPIVEQPKAPIKQDSADHDEWLLAPEYDDDYDKWLNAVDERQHKEDE